MNKGNVLYTKGDFEKAREFYREALQNDSSCVEALYNLGKFLQVKYDSKKKFKLAEICQYDNRYCSLESSGRGYGLIQV